MILLSRLAQYPLSSTSKSTPDLVRISNEINRNISSLIGYKQMTLILKSSNLLMSMFRVLPISISMDFNSQIIAVYNRGLEAVQGLGMTTPYMEGRGHKEVIFSSAVSERWIAYLGDHEDNRPVRCHSHPLYSLNVWLDEPISTGISETNVAIFTVNIVALVYNFRSMLFKNPDYSARQYIVDEILPSLISDIFKITIFNQYVNYINYTSPNREKVRTVPFWLDIHRNLQRVIDSVMFSALRGAISISDLADKTELMTNVTTWDIISSIPSLPIVKALIPDMIAMELPYANFLIQLSSEAKKVKPKDFINLVNYTIRTIETDRSLYSTDVFLDRHNGYYLNLLSTFRE